MIGISLDIPTVAALWGAAIPSFVPPALRANPPDVYVNLKTNQAWKKAGNQTVSADTLISVSRASAATQVDSLGNWTQVGSNVLARSDLGASIWEARTNSIRNNTNVGAVAGTPGTTPTNVAFTSAPNGLARQIVGFGVDAFGKNYIDVRWFGTATAGSLTFSSFDSGTTQIAATYGQTWTNSVWLSVVAGTQTNIGTFALRTSMRDAGGSALGAIDLPVALTSVDTRFVNSGTLSFAATAFLQPQLLATTAAGPVDITVRFSWPQLENNGISSTVASATIAAAGAGGVGGTAVYSVGGGTGTAATLNVTVTGGVITAINSVASAGSYTVFPPSPAALTYVSGTASGVTGATVTLTPTNNATSAMVSNPILTSGSAALRNNEINTLIMTGLPAVGSAVSVIAQATPQAATTYPAVQAPLEINDGSSNNRLNVRANNFTAQPRTLSVASNVATTLTTPGTWTQGASGKIAGTTAANDQAFSFNGGATVTSAAGVFPTGMNQVNIGNLVSGTQTWNGNVEAFGIWFNQRVPNAQLQSMTQ